MLPQTEGDLDVTIPDIWEYGVQLPTVRIINGVIRNRALIEIPEDSAYQVFWHIPGNSLIQTDSAFPPSFEDMLGGPLFTFNPLSDELVTFRPDLAPPENAGYVHLTPAWGPSTSQRVVFCIKEYVDSAENTTTLLLMRYLCDRHLPNTIIEEIRQSNSNQATKGKGQTPKTWVRWVEEIQKVKSAEKRVAESCLNETIRNKLISRAAFAAYFRAKAGWFNDCLDIIDLLSERENWPDVPA
ncbi:hypothetical protein R3P38DRAFT_3205640 [Favolaschia claudopus]|uniref:Uncharacterized protein n=1 Tax=Favolaschia claudopus TaxID=2862362 RepID=A0AAW0ARG0_9AGAR